MASFSDDALAALIRKSATYAANSGEPADRAVVVMVCFLCGALDPIAPESSKALREVVSKKPEKERG